MRVWPGRPYPRGATWDGTGVNFVVFSEHATRVELCLFDGTDTSNERRIELSERTDRVFHAYLPDVLPGQFYGYRVYGPYDPAKGLRFNPKKLIGIVAAVIVGIVGFWAFGPEPKGRTLEEMDEELAAPGRPMAMT